MSIDVYDKLKERFPIIDVVLRNVQCSENELRMLRELFLSIYSFGYNDGRR